MILVTGAAGYTGQRIVSQLAGSYRAVRCLVRREAQRDLFASEAEIHVGDLEQVDSVRAAFEGVDFVIHLAGMQVVKTLISCAPSQLKRIVTLSSLRRFSKVSSPSVAMVIEGEDQISTSGLPYTILQSSMIFGPGEDRNLSRLAAYLQNHRFIPVFGDGSGLQQPVFVDDVATVAENALFASASGTYPIAGPEPITYNQLVDMVGRAVGTVPRTLHLPVRPSAILVDLLARMGFRMGVDSKQVLRLQEDKSVSIDAARRDLDFAPTSFDDALRQIYGTVRSA